MQNATVEAPKWTLKFENDQAREVLEPLLPVGKGRTGRANATVVGRFEGPNKEGYGHLNSLPFRFVIIAVEKAGAVPPDVPWLWYVKKH